MNLAIDLRAFEWQHMLDKYQHAGPSLLVWPVGALVLLPLLRFRLSATLWTAAWSLAWPVVVDAGLLPQVLYGLVGFSVFIWLLLRD